MKEYWINIYQSCIFPDTVSHGSINTSCNGALLEAQYPGLKPLYRIHIKMKDVPNVPMSAKSLYDRYRAY